MNSNTYENTNKELTETNNNSYNQINNYNINNNQNSNNQDSNKLKTETTATNTTTTAPPDADALGTIQSDDSTDLIQVYEVSEDFRYVGCSSSVKTESCNEFIDYSSFGHLIDSTISIFNCKNKLIGAASLKNKQEIQNLSKSVGRLFVKYFDKDKEEGPNQSAIWFSGSAFCLSGDIIITSAHLVEKSKTIQCDKQKQTNRQTLLLQNIYIYFNNDATVDEEIDLDSIDEEDMFELQTVNIDNKHTHSYIQKLNYGSFKPSNETCIISLLTFLKKPKQQISYVLPQSNMNILNLLSKTTASAVIPATTEQSDKTELNDYRYFVIGYTSHIEFEEFKQLFILQNKKLDTQFHNNFDRLYTKITQLTFGFQKKSIYFSSLDAKISECQLSSHQCPTLLGASGGLFSSVEYPDRFIGIHLGGSKELESNFALSVLHPLFYYLYKNYVLSNEDFYQKHKEQLSEYIDYMENTNY